MALEASSRVDLPAALEKAYSLHTTTETKKLRLGTFEHVSSQREARSWSDGV
jgi:hypothetical protein